MKVQRYSIKFKLDKIKSNGKYPIRMVLTTHGTRGNLSIGIDISDPNWTLETCKDREVLNFITDIENKVRDMVRRFTINDEDFNASDLIRGLKTPTRPGATDRVCTYIAKKIRKSHREKDSTLQNYVNLLQHFESYRPDMTFKNVTKEVLMGFEVKLLDKGLMNSSVRKIMVTLKTIMRLAEEENLNVNVAWRTFDVIENKAESQIVCLTEDELVKLIQYPLSGREKTVRDMFVMSCATGMRFSDLYQFEWEHITEIGDGKQAIDFICQKTGRRVWVPINPLASKIIGEYKGHLKPVECEYQQFANVKIKEICREIGITQPVEVVEEYGKKRIAKHLPKCDVISFHDSRRTFATIALSKNVPVETVMMFTGHKSFEAFKKYVGWDKKQQMEQMQKFVINF